ncbi:DUF1642 domain-containing protein [Streptococcus pluranimalium]|uniref:DUF1642 domain-containing protein n=1 Tax=Streptococcus pluranimalium TaxID=82348 RepID=UPI0039FD79CE
MNNSEFKQGQEVLVRAKIKNPNIDRDGEVTLISENKREFWAKPENIITDIPERPSIPQYVADWIDHCKMEGYTMFHSIRISYGKTEEWLSIGDNEIVFTLAYGYGYTVENPKLYTVEIPNPNCDGYSIIIGWLAGRVCLKYTRNKTWKTDINNQLTEEEIRKDFEWVWQAGFAKEVE